MTIAPLLLPTPQVSLLLWLCPLDHDVDEIGCASGLLSAAEHSRAARFGPEILRRRWIAGRAALRLVLGNTLAIKPAAVALRRGTRGRPELAAGPRRLDFNVSHTDDVALIALGVGLADDERVGVDIEHANRKVNADGLARKFLSERERQVLAPLGADARRRAFLRLWTCKEAMSKATGDALSAPFRAIDVDVGDALRLLAGPPPYTPERWRLFAAEVGDTLIATVAIWKAM